MKIETKYDIASSVNVGAEYDKGVKKLFKSKEIIVLIMEMVIPEFEGCSQEEILNWLDLASITSDEVVSDAPVSETDEYRIRGEDAGIFDYLNQIFVGNIEEIETYSHIEWEEEFKEDVAMTMTGFSDILVRRGREEGREETTVKFIWSLHEMDFTDDMISEAVKRPIDYVQDILKKDAPQ
ncbi:MAG: hypothetical protein ACLVB7_03220 [Coprococcus comes]|uniref:hypothetical protein n=1 Tax=Coprococcus comes TaxID=410072 RepID=UPI001D07DB83|nr:hypothetical protein [Coprococcus comes]MCB6471070.1 hypothetical protein [Coprococcus comes]